jgi:hypothetical protein
MAIYKNTPPIITDGLTHYLDAANSKSYVTGSTIWNDLSGLRNSGSFTSGVNSVAIGGQKIRIPLAHSGAIVLADSQNRDHISKGCHSLSLDFASGVYLRLPSFTGSSSQSGSLGQMAVSGTSLYVCTGTSSPFWGRVILSSF